MVAPVLNGRLVGYARVRTDDQDLSLQIDSLTGLGINPADIFTEKISGAKTDRPVLNACLANLQRGDTLVVWRLDRRGRSMFPNDGQELTGEWIRYVITASMISPRIRFAWSARQPQVLASTPLELAHGTRGGLNTESPD